MTADQIRDLRRDAVQLVAAAQVLGEKAETYHADNDTIHELRATIRVAAHLRDHLHRALDQAQQSGSQATL
jgi:hypothetical protein